MDKVVPTMGPTKFNILKEQLYAPRAKTNKEWMNIRPDYKGKVTQQAKHLGCTLRRGNRKSITKGPKVAEAPERARRIGCLPLGFVVKGSMLRAAAQSCTMYGTASDPLTA